ncbi:nucleotidyltransferase [Mycoplasma elephantis]|uniref:nucleotidyltransferase n=1 Tax=Mycoplasma elephantis TaxID=114882 RepID=UPI0004819FEF|nr:nucleotidyltransferase [Mycoplasma elephantis]
MKKFRLGIVVEYNPFHNGHIFQLELAKKNFPDHDIYLFMSGKYTQRGEINILKFSQRVKWAKKYGVKKVIKLKQKYVIQAAHIFAEHAILMMRKYKINTLLFGSETNDIEIFKKIAKLTIDNTNLLNKVIKQKLKLGMSFPKANNEAIKEMMNYDISMPNDILGLEYVKSIYKYKLNIKPYCHKRTNGFHSNTPNGIYASATYIRNKIINNELQGLDKYTPINLNTKINRIEDKFKRFKQILKRTANKDLGKIKLVSEGIENLFKKNIDAKTYNEFVSRCNSKRYTSSRIKRVMLSILLKQFPLNLKIRKFWINFY